MLKTELWKHQLDGIEILKSGSKNGFLFWWEPGTGKSRASIEVMRHLFTKYKKPLRTIIICPDIVVSNWVREIDKYSLCGKYVQVLKGSKKDRIKLLEESDKQIFITNHEALSMEGVFYNLKTAKKKVCLIDRQFQMLIVDEIHRFKNPYAQRSRLLYKLADKVFFKIGLTGTPILKDIRDIWGQYRVIDGGATFGRYFKKFMEAYFFDENLGMPKDKYFPKWSIKEEIYPLLEKKSYTAAMAVKKSQCLDLPPLIEEIAETDLTLEQRFAYKEMADDYITYVNGGACIAKIALTKILRLQQIISGHMTLDDGTTHYFKNIRREAVLKELLEENIPWAKQIIVWTPFVSDYSRIRNVCHDLKLNCGMLTGQQNAEQKDEVVRKFSDGQIDVICGNPGAGGIGINLVESPLSIWYARGFKLADRLQAFARNYRGGSERHEKILSIDIIARNTIDEKIYNLLQEKTDLSDKFLSLKNSLL